MHYNQRSTGAADLSEDTVLIICPNNPNVLIIILIPHDLIFESCLYPVLKIPL